jgi:hypothetical protein
MHRYPNVLGIFGLVIVTGFAIAEPPKHSHLLGVWKLDTSKLPSDVQAPRSVALVVSDVGGGKWKTVIDTVNADGNVRQATYPRNGTPASVSDTMGREGRHRIDHVPGASVLAMGATLAGNLSTTRVFTVSPDGKHQTETILWRGEDGKPHIRTNAWTRVE